MKPGLIFILFCTILLTNSCEKTAEHDKYNPRIVVKTIISDQNYYDYAPPLDTLRIASDLTILFNAQSNGLTNSYIEKLRITDGLTGTIIKDTLLNKASFSLNQEFSTPLVENNVSWNISITDHIGNTADTTIQFFFDNKGILGEWHFEKTGIKGSYKEDSVEFIGFDCFADGTYELTTYSTLNRIERKGYYNQEENSSSDTWSLELNQLTPDTVTYSGLFEITGAQKDSIRIYFVQTIPDIGLEPPTQIVEKDNFEQGEHFLIGVLDK